MAQPQAMTLTDAAAKRVRHLLDQRGSGTALRIGVRTAGCSGMAYTFDYADHREPHDEVIEDKGVTLYIDAKAMMFLFGTEMDFVDDKLKSEFVFNNPNEKGRCGCGESFHI